MYTLFLYPFTIYNDCHTLTHRVVAFIVYLYTCSTRPALLDVLVAPVVKKDEIHSTNYVLLNGDLRDMNSVGDRMLAAGLDRSLPTMFLTECVLVYMEPEKSRGVIKWAGTNFSTALFLNYEPVRTLILQEAFGNGIIYYYYADTTK